MTGNVRRIGELGYIPMAPRLVAVPDMTALTALKGSLDGTLDTITEWTDLPQTRGDWRGLVIANPHISQNDWLRDDYFTSTWSDWACEHAVQLSLDFPGMPSTMTTSSPGAKRTAYVQMYFKEYFKSSPNGPTSFDSYSAAQDFIKANARTPARSDASCELVILDIVDGKLDVIGARVALLDDRMLV